MKIALTTPTGNVGRQVAEQLVGGVHKIRLLCRDGSKCADLVERGAEVAEGNLADVSYVREATQGIEMLFWVTPPDPTAQDIRKEQNRVAENVARAVQANRILRVVNLSSIGAHRGEGMGVVDGLHDVETKLNQTGAYITHLRPTFFYENFLPSLETIRDEGKIYFPVPPNVRIPMIATRDIADVAVSRLADDKWRGRPVRELLGPADLSFSEATAGIGEGIGKRLEYVPIEESAYDATLEKLGVGESFRLGLHALHRSFLDPAPLGEQPRSEESTTPTTIQQFAAEVLKPMLEAESPASS